MSLFAVDTTIGQEAQNSSLDVIKDSLQVCDTEYNPLQRKISRNAGKAHKKRSLEIQFVNRLESADENSLSQVRNEMEELSERLDMLKRIEDVLSDMDPDAIDNAIADGKQKQDELMESLKKASEPMQAEMSNLQREYAHRNGELVDAIKNFLKPNGTGPFDGFKLKFANANFASATFNCSYDTKVEDSNFNVTVQLKSLTNLPAREFDKLDDNYVIYQWTETNLILLRNNIQISAYDPGRRLGKQKLMDAVKQLIDLKGMATID